MEQLPLHDITVCDITQNLAGPLSARLLAELGAEVIHVEKLTGDNARGITTDYLGGEGLFHQLSNRSKKGIAVDLKAPEGADIVRRLVAQSDVLLESQGPGAMDRLGLGYPELSAKHPRLVYGSVSAYGVAGRAAGLKGYDFLIQGLAGLTRPNATGGRDFVVGGPFADTATPLLLALGVVAALRARELTGRGQWVQTSLLQGALHMLGPNLLQVDDDPDLNTSARPAIGANDPSTGAFRTLDGRWLAIVAFNDDQFRKLSRCIGRDDLAADPGLATQTLRGLRSEEVREIIAKAVASRTADEWMSELLAADVPCERVYDSPKEMMFAPAVWKDEAFCDFEHPTKGRMVQAATGISYGDDVLRAVSAAPRLGQDTATVLARLGYSAHEIEDLEQSGVVLCAPEQPE
jgi:crotonobetainyl-CoA:carnitine CoA-transferase CaiB-like acyl-CoA transferase